MTSQLESNERVTLVDALDRVLEKGVVVDGEIVIRVADVDLVFAGLRLTLTSISKAEELYGASFSNPDAAPDPDDLRQIAELKAEIRRAEQNIPRLIDASDPKRTEQGVARLVLTLVELIRQVMAKEGARRMKRGALSATQAERLGLSLKALKRKTQEMQALFGIEDEDLNVDLGPLGKLL